MEIERNGFPVAIVEEKSDTDFFEQVCPVFYYNNKCQQNIWGNIEKAVIGYSSNKKIRHKASSGGALTEICIYMLEKKLVDGIIHTTYDEENPTKTISCISYTKEEVQSRCGSRYSISTPLLDIFQIIDKEKKYAFVGKPCDVMALRNFLNMNHMWQEKIPYLLSFFCAGEPSVNAQEKLLQKMGCHIEDCEKLTYRGEGWPGYTTIVKKDGSISKLEYKVAWGQYLGRDLRTICRFCMDGTGDAADIVCADFWYLDENGNPEFVEHDGRNIIIARTLSGTQVLEDAINEGNLICESNFTDNMDEFYKYQPHQYKRKGTMKSMIYAMRICGHATPAYSKSYLNEYSKHVSAKIKMRYFFGIMKRVIKGSI